MLERFGKRRFTHVQIIALGFFIMIALGTALLMLPCATAEGVSAPFNVALLTATSASCVTGLVLVDTGTYWSLFGQIVILLLIQVGGLGFMSIATMFFLLLRKRIGLRQREVMSESINVSQIGGVLALTRTIVLGTILIEAVGALLLSIRFVPEFGLWRGLYFSLFHAVSAFCNAGFDLMGVKEPFSSMTGYSGDALVNLTLVALIAIGGFGFLVWEDVRCHGLRFRRYRLHSKLVLTVSAVLTLGGALLFYLFERKGLCAGRSAGEQILTVLFDAVAPRTAGFNTTDTAALSNGSRLLTMFLMLVGGSPGSTAGGIKTTTLCVLALHTIAGFRHGRSTNVYGRRLEQEAIDKAARVFFTNLSLAFFGALVIMGVQELRFSDVLFEVFSAIGTVGMTTGVTRELLPLSQMVIILLMYCGRVGSVSFGLALLEKRAPARVENPVERITIG